MSLRVGIVGYGEIARYHARHLTAAGAKVVGVVSRQKPPDVKVYSSLAGMLPSVDAVTIAVPNSFHAALCMEAVAAGVPVFVEKPLCIEESELKKLERVLPAARSPVHLGFRLRWNPFLRAVRLQLAGVSRLRCAYRLGIAQLAAGKPWTLRQAESGGGFFTLGVHALDLARWLTGAESRPLQALRASASHRRPSADFPLLVRVEGRVPGGPWIEAEADLRHDEQFRLEIETEVHGLPSASGLPGPRPDEPGAPDAEYAAMMRAFVEAAHRGRPDPEALAEVLQCHRELMQARSLAAST